MGLVTPDYGLVFWMILAFSILLFILKKFAWKPILQGLRSREESIERSLKQAELARKEMERLQEEGRALAEKARQEREKELQETRQFREKLIVEAKETARIEYQKMIEKARVQIRQEKEAAKKELYNTVAQLAIDVLEQVIRKELDKKEQQVDLINKLIEEMSGN